MVVWLSFVGATYLRDHGEGLQLNERSAVGNLLTSLPQSPVFCQASVCSSCSCCLASKGQSLEESIGAQQPGKMVFKGGIWLISLHVCNLATV